MSTYLWKVRANKKWNDVAQGMEVDVVIKGRSGEPNIREIADALTNKYGIKNLGGSGMSTSIFDITKG
jgi:hypothetical protein